MRYVLSKKEIERIIDSYVSRNKMAYFVCNRELAEFIEDYVADKYDLWNDGRYDDDCNEFYVAILPVGYIEDYRFRVEDAFGLFRNYKLCDPDVDCHYYIFTDMPTSEVERCFENGTIWYCEFEQEKLTCKDCICCAECEEEQIISELLEFVFDGDACMDCKMKKIIKTLYEFKDRGTWEG